MAKKPKTYTFHALKTIGQECICQRCHRRWDFDELPDDDEKCEIDK